ncbi:YdeI/OmpD-associated family protein [Arthrobacter sp. SIMBA_036]|uniref:YdeI/OmpD-associated family protein n=1 Tax=Arthrobacter sp. SIMBA_036 TaxID=3085778 RepID=UPI003978EAA5
MKFTTTIVGDGNKAGIEIPSHVVDGLGAGKRPPVVVTINGQSYRSSIAVMGGKYMVGVSSANRELTGAEAGHTVEVGLEVDTEPRVIEVPDDLAAALDAEPDAKAFYGTLNYSSQRRYVEPIGDAKTEETRARRIAKVVADLKAGKK